MRTEREQNRPSEPTSKAETVKRTPRARAAAGRTLRETAQIINLMEILAAALKADVQSALKEPMEPMTIEVAPMIIEREASLANTPSAEDDEVDVDAILKRLDQGIAAEHAAMDRLLARIVSRASQ